MKKKVMLSLFIGSMMGMGVSAQNIIAVDEYGNQVKRINFDCEQVEVVLVDGQVLRGVDATVIIPGHDYTSVQDVESTLTEKGVAREIFDLQGRRVVDVDRLPAGIYVLREGDKVYKLIKK